MKTIPPVIVHDTASWCHTCNPGLKMHPIERMVELLKQKTEEQAITWERDSDNLAIFNLYKLENYIIQIGVEQSKAALHICNRGFALIDEYESPSINDLYSLARRQVMSADNAIDNIIKQLEKAK
jgi:hypothetical protein